MRHFTNFSKLHIVFCPKPSSKTILGNSRLKNLTLQSDLGHGHGAVALIVSKLGLLVGRQGQWRVFQFGVRRPDGQAKNLLELLADVEHGVTTASPLLLQCLRTPNKRWFFG